MDIEQYAALWDNRPVRLLDVRRYEYEINQAPSSQICPSNTFLFVMRGRGIIWLDQEMHRVDTCYAIHGSQGAHLSVIADEAIELYWVVYMFVGPLPVDAADLNAHFGMQLSYPSPLLAHMAQLQRQWENIDYLERIQLTSQFYQWLYELLKQIRQHRALASGLDRTTQIIGYFAEHYKESLTVEHVAAAFNCSTRYINRLFHNRLHMSPGRVLAQIRMAQATRLLRQTEATLQNIAEQVGYANGFTLSRYFKKNFGISPKHYREQLRKYGPTFEIGASELDSAVKVWLGANSEEPVIRGNNNPSARTLATPMGSIQVPATPSRVVVDWDIGHVLALGVTPLGAPYSLIGGKKWLEPYTNAEAVNIGNHNHISLEKVLALEPDLIITWDPGAYASYARIAPTVVYQSGAYQTIAEEMQAMGHILNRQEEAAAWLSEFVRRTTIIRNHVSKYVPPGRTFTIADPNWGEHVDLIGNSKGRGGRAVYELLGFKPAEKVRREIIEQGLEYAQIDRREISAFLGDYLLMLNSPHGSSATHSILRHELDKVSTCEVINLEWSKYFLSDPLSTLLQAEEIAQRITAAGPIRMR
ncbi:AraC family transcriptional regulator [Paenibacillus sp. FSL H8-0537]|uniref:AraC family transcriptional regulator n=1 Tax=Paenibacillus sp. FSL H8-0537 TaxID=2921399 RepID=UPI0031014BDA